MTTDRDMTVLGYYIIKDGGDGSASLHMYETAAAAELEIKRMAESDYEEYALSDYTFKTLCQYHIDEAASEADIQLYFDYQRSQQRTNGSDEDIYEDEDE